MKIKKTIFLLTSGILLLAVLAGAVLTYGFITSSRLKVELSDLTLKLVPESGISLADDVRADLDITLPLCRNMDNVTVMPPKGSVLVGTPQIHWSNLRLTTRKWQVQVLLRPLKEGKLPSGSLKFDVTRPGEVPQNFTAQIPAFEVKGTTAAEKLELAGAIETSPKGISPWYWLLLLLPAGLWLAWALRRPAKPHKLTEWEKTVTELNTLRNQLNNLQLSPEQAFIALTELMRRYLERRFGLPVTRSTAQEFMSIMDQYGSIFPPESRPFLREFLSEADLVKFAKVVPETETVVRSAESASQFFSHTRPESEVKNV